MLGVIRANGSWAVSMEHTPERSTSPPIDVSSLTTLDREINPAIDMPSEGEAVGHNKSPTTGQSLFLAEFAPVDNKRRKKNDNIAVLLKARTDLDEALRWCEKRLASMEGDYLRRWPNVLAATPQQASTFCTRFCHRQPIMHGVFRRCGELVAHEGTFVTCQRLRFVIRDPMYGA